MPRKPHRQPVSQKGKNGQRPRAFHRGRAQGAINDKLLRNTLEPAFAAAAEDRVVVAETTKQHRASVREWEDVLAQCSRVSGSCARAPLPDPLLG